jgi:hypothetical protein
MKKVFCTLLLLMMVTCSCFASEVGRTFVKNEGIAESVVTSLANPNASYTAVSQNMTPRTKKGFTEKSLAELRKYMAENFGKVETPSLMTYNRHVGVDGKFNGVEDYAYLARTAKGRFALFAVSFDSGEIIAVGVSPANVKEAGK